MENQSFAEPSDPAVGGHAPAGPGGAASADGTEGVLALADDIMDEYASVFDGLAD